MNYAPVKQISTARHIARSAQRLIKSKTGMKVSLVMGPQEDTLKAPWTMLEIIADALDVSPDCYRLRSRSRDICELRFLGAFFVRRHFHNVTLSHISGFFGGQDHSSILSGIARAHNLVYTNDDRFMKKYQKALKAVNTWLRNEA
jgi:chromosomal replication initiation ATPase DnaA